MKLNELQLWIDHAPRSAAGQMGLDEAAFSFCQETGIALLRAYQWREPAVTIGYFDLYPQGESRPVIRRITGGGLVEHGRDVTFCLTLPPGCEATRASTANRYHWIHEALCRVLVDLGIADLGLQTADSRDFGTPSSNRPCFTHPVKWDLLDAHGRKLAGGAQRKSRGAVIHQGSILLGEKNLGKAQTWLLSFASVLAGEIRELPPSSIAILQQTGQMLSEKKYSNPNWCRSATRGFRQVPKA